MSGTFLLLGMLLGCGGASSDEEAVQHALSSGSYRFCHEAGLDAEQLQAWCDVVDKIPEDRCPGLRASCEGAAPLVSSDGCNEPLGSSGDHGERDGLASEPEPPPEPWSFEPWEGFDVAFLAAVSQWLMAILVASGVGLLLYFLWRRFGAIGDGPTDLPDVPVAVSAVDEEELDDALPEVPSAPSEDLLAMARRALDDGRPGEAVVLARGASLRRLGELGRLRLHRSRTDREYVRALEREEEGGDSPAGSAEKLRAVVSMVERFRFGHREPPSNGAAAALAAASRLLGSMVVLMLVLSGATPAFGQTAPRYGPYGDAAFAELYRLHGYEVRWRLRGLTDLKDADADVLLLDALAAQPSEEEWDALRAWVARGHVLFVIGDAGAGFPELGVTGASISHDAYPMGPLRAAGLAPPVLPSPVSVYHLPEAGPSDSDDVGEPEVWAEDGADGALMVSITVGAGAVVAVADTRLGDNVSLASPANEELLGEAPLIGQAMRGWPLASPPRVQLAMRASNVTSENQANNPLESLARAELLPFVLQFLLLWSVVALWRGWPMGPLRDPPERGRIRFADHVEALGERYQRLRASRHVLKAYAGLWLQRLGPKGMVLAATATGLSREDAQHFVAELEALVDGTDEEGGSAQTSARTARADLERMEALWSMVEHPRASSEESQ